MIRFRFSLVFLGRCVIQNAGSMRGPGTTSFFLTSQTLVCSGCVPGIEDIGVSLPGLGHWRPILALAARSREDCLMPPSPRDRPKPPATVCLKINIRKCKCYRVLITKARCCCRNKPQKFVSWPDPRQVSALAHCVNRLKKKHHLVTSLPAHVIGGSIQWSLRWHLLCHSSGAVGAGFCSWSRHDSCPLCWPCRRRRLPAAAGARARPAPLPRGEF